MTYVVNLIIIMCSVAQIASCQIRASSLASLCGNTGYTLRGSDAAQLNGAGLIGIKALSITGSFMHVIPGTKVQHFSVSASGSFRRNEAFEVGIQKFGFEYYKQVGAFLKYSRLIFEGTRLGIGVNLNNLSIPNYGSVWDYAIDIGFQVDVTQQLVAAGFIRIPGNYFQPELEVTQQDLTLVELGYQPLKVLRVMMLFRHTNARHIEIGMGIIYAWKEKLQLLAGSTLGPGTISLGIRSQWKDIMLTIGFNMHPILGSRPILGGRYFVLKDDPG